MMTEQNIRIEVVEITPELASQFLAKNRNFRTLNERRAEFLSTQIQMGRWQLNGESIKFDEKGNLVDGQHRLRGCVLAKQSIKSVVAFGVDDTNVDTGNARTLSQLLHANGYIYSTQLGSTGNFVFRFQKYGKFFSNEYVSRDDILQLLQAHPQMLEAVQFTTKTSHLFGRWSLHAAIYFMFCELSDVDEATRFYQSLINGTDLSDKNPIYHLREKLIQHKIAEAKLPSNPYAGLIIKGWNLWMTKGEIKNLRYNFQRENIPEIATKRIRPKNDLKFKGEE